MEEDDYTSVETADLQILVERAAEADYYERLIDYLMDVVPCLDDLIANFEETED